MKPRDPRTTSSAERTRHTHQKSRPAPRLGGSSALSPRDSVRATARFPTQPHLTSRGGIDTRDNHSYQDYRRVGRTPRRRFAVAGRARASRLFRSIGDLSTSATSSARLALQLCRASVLRAASTGALGLDQRAYIRNPSAFYVGGFLVGGQQSGASAPSPGRGDGGATRSRVRITSTPRTCC